MRGFLGYATIRGLGRLSPVRSALNPRLISWAGIFSASPTPRHLFTETNAPLRPAARLPSALALTRLILIGPTRIEAYRPRSLRGQRHSPPLVARIGLINESYAKQSPVNDRAVVVCLTSRDLLLAPPWQSSLDHFRMMKANFTIRDRWQGIPCPAGSTPKMLSPACSIPLVKFARFSIAQSWPPGRRPS